jgi:hypothetical protein
MQENKLYDYLQSLMPDLQFVNPYTDNVPLPKAPNYATFNILDVSDRGWSQPRQTAYDPETGIITLAYDVQRIYRVQLDFYGPDAFDNASVFKQTLQVNLAENFGIADLKEISPIRNLTFLQENKRYMRRYNFDAEVFVVDTITRTSPAIETAEVTIVNRGNNF